jgi:hypothetical protein
MGKQKHGLFHSIRKPELTDFVQMSFYMNTPTNPEEAKLFAENNISGTYTTVGTFNDHPVYSNGINKWVYMDSSIDPAFETPGYYLMDEPNVTKLTTEDLLDLSDEFIGYFTEE